MPQVAKGAVLGFLTEAEKARIHEYGEDARGRLRIAHELASSGLKTLTVINGGAIVALFALIGQGAQSSFVKQMNVAAVIAALALFALGVATSLGATIAGFWSQQWIAVYEQEIVIDTLTLANGREVTKAADFRDAARGNRYLTIGVWLALSSIALFVLGAGAALASALATARS